MSDVNGLCGFVTATWEVAGTQHGGQKLESSNLEVDLNFVDGVAAR